MQADRATHWYGADIWYQHTPAHFEYIQRDLEAAGYRCVGVDLPCQNRAVATIDDDVVAIRQMILTELDKEKDVVVVTHSYGSIPGTAACEGFSAHARHAAGKATSVKSAVIIAGFLLPVGATMLGMSGGKLRPQYLHEGDTTLPFNGPGAVHILYHDLEQTEAEKAIWRLKPQAFAINTSPIPDQAAGLTGIPLSYLACTDDHAVEREFQAGTIAAFSSAGIEVSAEVAICGHSPFLKLPTETAKFIRKAAGEDLKTGFDAFTPETYMQA